MSPCLIVCQQENSLLAKQRLEAGQPYEHTANLAVMSHQDEDMGASTRELASSSRGIATIVLEVVSYAAMLPFIYIELRSIEEYRDDWLNAWNILDVIAYANQVPNTISSDGMLALRWLSIHIKESAMSRTLPRHWLLFKAWCGSKSKAWMCVRVLQDHAAVTTKQTGF